MNHHKALGFLGFPALGRVILEPIAVFTATLCPLRVTEGDEGGVWAPVWILSPGGTGLGRG